MTDDGSNYIQFAFVRGEWSCTARADSAPGLFALLDETFGDGTFAAVRNSINGRIGNTAIDGAVTQLQQAGVATTPVASTNDAPPFVPGTGPTPSFVPPGTPQATFPPPQPAAAGPKTLGQWGGFDVVLWAEGKYGANVQLKGGKGPDGKDLRANLAKGENPASVDVNRAIQLLQGRQQYLATKA